MAEQDWLRPELPAEHRQVQQHAPAAPFTLRPLSLGELLDRTFTLYRSRFALFAGITMFAAAVQVVTQALGISMMQKVSMLAAPHAGRGATPFGNLRGIGSSLLVTYSVLLVYYLVSAVTQAATALAVTRVYLQRTATVKDALLRVLPRWYRWVGIALWQVWSLVWVPVALVVPGLVLLAFSARTGSQGLLWIGGALLTLGFFGGFAVGVIEYIRNALAIPAAIMERLKVRPAMRRSKTLAAGAKGRIFVLLLIVFGLLEVVGVLEAPLSFLIMARPQQSHVLARGIGLLITFVGHTVVAPVLLIGLTLAYFDQRVRREAFDLELMLENARPAATSEETLLGAADASEGYAPLP